jgi:hypothetical protein
MTVADDSRTLHAMVTTRRSPPAVGSLPLNKEECHRKKPDN